MKTLSIHVTRKNKHTLKTCNNQMHNPYSHHAWLFLTIQIEDNKHQTKHTNIATNIKREW